MTDVDTLFHELSGVEGTPTVLIEDGDFVVPHLRKEGVERSELEMAMREHGVGSVQEVRLAGLETDGSSPVVRTRKHLRQFRQH